MDETLAQLLVTEGFTKVEELAYLPVEELAEIEGFDGDIANELHERALEFIEKRNSEFEEKRKALGVSDEVAGIEGLTPAMLVALGARIEPGPPAQPEKPCIDGICRYNSLRHCWPGPWSDREIGYGPVGPFFVCAVRV